MRLERVKDFFQEGLWNFHLSREKGWRRFYYKWLRIAYLSLRGFIQDKCSLSASSLTYYTLMSIVPILAMSIAIARGFGYHEILRNELLERFKDQQAAFSELFSYADKFLEQAKGGIIAGVGLVVLFWSVTLLLNTLETILNHIWGVKRMRSWRRILSDYFALMLIGPFFFILFSSITVFIVDHLEMLVRAWPLGSVIIGLFLFLINLLPYALFWILFTFVYLFMPNTRVKFRSAIWGGLFAGSFYVIVQWGYIYFQVGVSRYGAIYGSMAALPLFLVWIQLSWFLLLLGAEISYAHQTLEEHEFEGIAAKASYSFKRLVSLWIVHLVIHRFLKGEAPITREILVTRYQIPNALAAPILNDLSECGLLCEIQTGYIPARPIDSLRISDVLEALETKGMGEFPFIDSKALAPFEKALEHFRSQIEKSPENKLMSHVSHTI